MSDWQQIIKDQSIASLEKLAEKFGHDVIDVDERTVAARRDCQRAAVRQRCGSGAARAPRIRCDGLAARFAPGWRSTRTARTAC